MYSWGDDTKTWKKPSSYDYGSARAPYLEDLAKEAETKGPRSYALGKGPKLELVDPKGKTISTKSEDPVILAVDGTGSMQHWPAEIFDRLPLLYQTLSKYRPGVELSFSVIGDAAADQWPVQVTSFGKEIALDDYLKALHPEGGGGPGIRESYELWAYFMQEHCQTPNAISPFLIIMGDEKFYEKIDPAQVQHYLGDKLQGALDAMQVWQKLTQRFDIYLLRKPYPGHDEEITAQWKEAVGGQKVIPVYDPMRVVDVAMGIVAKRWGQFGDFELNLASRQEGGAVATVMQSLRYVPEAAMGSMKSKVEGKGGSKKSKSLTKP
ncbi:hypothetical protein HYS48_04215 [Candidatus Woesearchaeota archaeon]|nr:hypothetical protein [Candidatus Woesearchaeota archaeon]